MNLLSFGEIVWDVHGENVSLGGAPLNFAAHAAMQRARAVLVSAVGNDALGLSAIKCARQFGVETQHISLLEGRETAKCVVTDNDKGLPSYKLMDNTAFDCIAVPNILEYMDVISFGTLSLRHENNRNVIGEILKNVPHSEVFCDINLRTPFYSADTVKYCFSNATLLKLSDEELVTVGRLFSIDCTDMGIGVRRLCEVYRNIRLLIITMGADGSLCYDSKNESFFRCKAKKIEAVSTVGAGDSFSASFLVRYMGGKNIVECLEYASEISAMVCESPAAFSEDMAERIEKLNKGWA